MPKKPKTYEILLHGELCPVTGENSDTDICIHHSAFDHNEGTGRCVFFSHIVIGGFGCCHPSLTRTDEGIGNG